MLVGFQGKNAKTRYSHHSESGPFFGVVKATELRRSKERDWSFSQFAGFGEKVQIMQDKNYRVLAALMCLVWFNVPFALELMSEETPEVFWEPVVDSWWKHVWIWTSFFFWPYSGRCGYNAVCDAHNRIGGWYNMLIKPFFVVLPAVVIGGSVLAGCGRGFLGFGNI